MRKKQEEVRQLLIDGTIHVIATHGLGGATTKQISKATGINEAYIYRYFEDKDDLFVKAFSKLDNELISKILEHIHIMDMTQLYIEDRCRLFFCAVWKFLLGNSQKCTCFIQYYYSPYFTKYSQKEHRENYQIVVEKFQPAFREGTNTWMILHHMLDMLLSSAMAVFRGELADNDDTALHVFSLLYSSIEQQMVWAKRTS